MGWLLLFLLREAEAWQKPSPDGCHGELMANDEIVVEKHVRADAADGLSTVDYYRFGVRTSALPEVASNPYYESVLEHYHDLMLSNVDQVV